MTNEANRFMKRLYTPKDFYRLMVDMLANIKDMREASRSGRVSKKFAERIMMAVTEVNGCRYCSYFHARMALQAGLKKEEIRKLLDGEFNGVPEEEIAALYFAQHYAEEGGHPNREAIQCLEDTYGESKTRDIFAYIRAIMIGNAWGNMFDALGNRLRGKACQETTIWQELGVVVGVVFMMPFAAVQIAVNKIF